MSGIPTTDRRTVRRQATIDEIVDAAWEQVRDHALAALSMRELGERVGMRAQSLYSYFASKHEIYDAMFRQGNEAFLAMIQEDGGAGAVAADPAGFARRASHRFFEFCVSDPVRYQLLFQRTIPDFVPSEARYAVAQQAFDLVTTSLGAIGVRGAGVDLWTATLSGLVAQQLANDPGGDRWARLVDDAVEMLLARLAPAALAKTTRKRAG